jgi:hypothetical protein
VSADPSAAPAAAAAAPSAAPASKKKRPSHAATVVAAKGFFNYVLGLPGKDKDAGSSAGGGEASATDTTTSAAAGVEQFLGYIRSLAFNATATSVPAIVNTGKRAVQTLSKHKNNRQTRSLDLEASVAAYAARLAGVPDDAWAATNGKWLTVFKLPRNITAQELADPGFALTEEESKIFQVRCALVVYNLAVQKGNTPLGLASETGKIQKIDGEAKRILAHPVDGDRLYIDRVYAYIAHMKGTAQTPFAPVSADMVKLPGAKTVDGDDGADHEGSLVSGVLSAVN